MDYEYNHSAAPEDKEVNAQACLALRSNIGGPITVEDMADITGLGMEQVGLATGALEPPHLVQKPAGGDVCCYGGERSFPELYIRNRRD